MGEIQLVESLMELVNRLQGSKRNEGEGQPREGLVDRNIHKGSPLGSDLRLHLVDREKIFHSKTCVGVLNHLGLCCE